MRRVRRIIGEFIRKFTHAPMTGLRTACVGPGLLGAQHVLAARGDGFFKRQQPGGRKGFQKVKAKGLRRASLIALEPGGGLSALGRGALL